MKSPRGLCRRTRRQRAGVGEPRLNVLRRKGGIWVTNRSSYPAANRARGATASRCWKTPTATARSTRRPCFSTAEHPLGESPSGMAESGSPTHRTFCSHANTEGTSRRTRSKRSSPASSRRHARTPQRVHVGSGWLAVRPSTASSNFSHVKYVEGNPTIKRIIRLDGRSRGHVADHPRTREFQVYAGGPAIRGGSPLTTRGSFFLSACVIDHCGTSSKRLLPPPAPAGGPIPAPRGRSNRSSSTSTRRPPIAASPGSTAPPIPSGSTASCSWGTFHGNCVNTDVNARKGASYFGPVSPTSSSPTMPGSCGRPKGRPRRLPVRPRLVRP